jgi:hypothetical protein
MIKFSLCTYVVRNRVRGSEGGERSGLRLGIRNGIRKPGNSTHLKIVKYVPPPRSDFSMYIFG